MDAGEGASQGMDSGLPRQDTPSPWPQAPLTTESLQAEVSVPRCSRGQRGEGELGGWDPGRRNLDL